MGEEGDEEWDNDGRVGVVVIETGVSDLVSTGIVKNIQEFLGVWRGRITGNNIYRLTN